MKRQKPASPETLSSIMSNESVNFRELMKYQTRHEVGKAFHFGPMNTGKRTQNMQQIPLQEERKSH